MCWGLLRAEKDGRRSERDRLRERERELEWDAADREAEEKERRRLRELEQERQRLSEIERHNRRRKRSRSRSQDSRDRSRNPGDTYDRPRDSRRARVDDNEGSRGRSSRGDEYANGGAAAGQDDKAVKEDDETTFDTELTAEELRMMQAMGIPFTFDTTQGKHVEDESANAGAVKIKSKRSARQFMNRRGGFNRPLPAERTGEKVVRD